MCSERKLLRCNAQKVTKFLDLTATAQCQCGRLPFIPGQAAKEQSRENLAEGH